MLHTWLERANTSDLHAQQSILARPQPGRHTDLPPTARYLRRCFTAFESIKLIQNTSTALLNHTLQAEPVFENNRWEITADPKDIDLWNDEMDVTHVLSILNTNSTPFTYLEWAGFIDAAMPDNVRNRNVQYRDRWRKRQFDILNQILQHVTPQHLQACIPPVPPEESYVSITQGNRTTFALKRTDGQLTKYHLTKLSTRPTDPTSPETK